MQIFDSVTGDFPDGPEPTQGRTFPIFDSVVGAAALTVKPPGEIRRLARCARRQRALPGDRVSLGQLIKNLEPSRRAGYHARGSRHLIDGQHQSDYWSIAMPLPVLAWTCPIVLGVAGPVARIRTREIYIVGLMRQALDRHVRVATDQKVAPLQEACA
jgi:DNA-binding IclR family transcriptional regulator